ncbi:MAG TPA: type II toxin-antitoxin system HicA family toxin [Hyphomicrobiaceae bacterium]
MSSRLPALKARDILKALEKAGFVVVRSKGSHRICEHVQDPSRRTVIPDHGPRDLPRGTVRSIIEQAGLSVEEFLDLL